jgi:hypothetical protein
MAALCLAALITRRERAHAVIVVLVLGYQIYRVFRFYDTIG